ncbi:hypothetical protein A9Q87_03055 [Flavobacteriales bacterium 34_180_T64]|nr:hypothetical protein A9Q87_03055 [Flavobacteriales bacterium 34_180_T64]
MKTKLLFITMLFTFSTSIVNGQIFEVKPTGTTHLLYDLSIPPGQNLVAYAAGSQYTVGGYGGVIIKSIDGGETWETVYSHEVNAFLQVEFVSETRGFALGFAGIMLKTIDGGATWDSITLPVESGYPIYELTVLDFVDVNNGFIAGITEDPSVNSRIGFTTSDSGETWVPVLSTSGMAHFCGDFAAPNIIYTAGKDHEWSKSIDNGGSWTQIDWDGGPSGQYYFAMKFKDQDNGIISTEDGELRITHDGGGTFNTVLDTGYQNFYALSYNGDVLYAGGTDLDIYRSMDNGFTWTLLFDGAPVSTLYTIEFFDNGDALTCGSGGTILKATANDLLGVEEFNQVNTGLSHSYNYIDKTLSIKTTNGLLLSKYSIYDTTGKLVVINQNLATNNIGIDVQTLSDGIYIVKCVVEDRIVAFKYVKH